jgi:hypothetical protein
MLHNRGGDHGPIRHRQIPPGQITVQAREGASDGTDVPTPNQDVPGKPRECPNKAALRVRQGLDLAEQQRAAAGRLPKE